MTKRTKAVFNWSGGKDSALALLKVLNSNEFEVVSLLTTIDNKTQTSSIHDVPLTFLLKQAQSIGIPLHEVSLSKNKSYEEGMTEAATYFKRQGVTHFIFGDIFLEDVRSYRENILLPLGIEIVEPLWGKSSNEVMEAFLASGIYSKIIVTQADQLNQSFIGRNIDRAFIQALPKGVDHCGENGEYHSFAYKGGPFKETIDFQISEPRLISHQFTLDKGETKNANYWKAEILDTIHC